MKKLFVLITLFATVWQAQAADWGSRLQAEQDWLVQSLTPPVEQTAEVYPDQYKEDSISTGQAAPAREEKKTTEEVINELTNPWDIRNSDASDTNIYKPARKRSR